LDDSPTTHGKPFVRSRRREQVATPASVIKSLDDLRNDAGTDSLTAFADSETNVLLDSDRADELNGHLDVVARHAHLDVFRKINRTGDVGRAEVELRTVARHERGASTAFILAQDIDVAFELHVRSDRAGLGDDLTALDFLALDAAKEKSNVVASLTLIHRLLEHLNAGNDGLLGFLETKDLDFRTRRDHTALDTTGSDRTATFNGEDVFDRHEERLIDFADRFRNIVVDRVHEFVDALGFFRIVRIFLSRKSGAANDRDVVAVEVMLREKFANFKLDELKELLVVDEVALVEEDDDLRNVNLVSEEDVLGGLRHRAVDCGNDENRAVHLSRASDHVLNEVRVTGAVDMSVVTIFGLIFNVSDGDRNGLGSVANGTALSDFRVGLNLGESLRGLYGEDRGGQSRLAMVDVSNSTNVNVRLGTLKSFLCH